MNDLDSYSVGFIKECYRQGLMEKQAAVLLDAALTSGLQKDAGWGSIIGKGLKWGAGLAGLGAAGYAAHRGLQESDSAFGRMYRRIFPGGMDLDPYEQSMVKYEPQKADTDPYGVSDWSRSSVYSTTPVESKTSNDAGYYQNMVIEANRRREQALRDKRDEYGNVSDADRKVIEDQFTSDKQKAVDAYNKNAVPTTNVAAAKQLYHRNRILAEASRQDADASRRLAQGQNYGMFTANQDNNYSWGGRLLEKAKGWGRGLYDGLGITNSSSDIARLKAQQQQARDSMKRMNEAAPIRTIGYAKNVGDIF